MKIDTDRQADTESIQVELDRVAVALRAEPLDTERYGLLYAVQQALGWVLEPSAFKSPYALVTSTSSGSEDCPVCPGPPLS